MLVWLKSGLRAFRIVDISLTGVWPGRRGNTEWASLYKIGDLSQQSGEVVSETFLIFSLQLGLHQLVFSLVCQASIV